ncbi:MAG TPA: ABC transporter ATP-binding protein [Candidatus Ornithomonoglobus merdipullorum]|uniref:ABC transporter ATP-binding protein n=1 Tax=Candidatus Ornithomonoglobus merdipullorum TaxID=2840895 RepID=A0A9D1MAF6_9FIRM|nr:ABC transporter ATP-binding protein [Candidatus Ornithomonoglobus merdipullorum]
MKKKVNRKYIIARLWKYICRYKGLAVAAIFLTITSNVLALIGPALSGEAINAVEPGRGAVDFGRVFFYCAVMAVIYALSALLSYILSRVMIRLSRNIVQRMRKDVFDKLMDLPVGYFDSHHTGDIISRISYDIDTVNASLSNDLLQICTSVITVVGSFIGMLLVSPRLLAVFAVTIPVTIVFTKLRTAKVRPLFRLRSGKLGELNGFSEEMVSGLKTIKAYRREDAMIKRYDAVNEDAAEAYYNADYYGSTVGPSVNFINNISLVLVSAGGAVLYLMSMLTLGDVSSFMLYSRKFSGPINEAANILSELQSAFAAAERVFALIDEPPESEDAPDAAVLSDVKGSVEFEHVKFGYGEDEIIHDLSFSVKPGSTVAIAGPTGAGKTTIINLLMRFYDIDSGNIYIDGHEIRGITRKSLRGAFTMVLQDTWLFGGTIEENIAYGSENVTREDVIRAAKAARIHDYIMSLPDGYDTVLSDDGVNVSKGQKQLLTIARAMLLNAPMVILDEATSNVDTRTELLIQEAMNRLTEGRTSFIIAHRLSTIQNADMILVISGGDIAECGTHEELLAKGGVYSEMYRSQFES